MTATAFPGRHLVAVPGLRPARRSLLMRLRMLARRPSRPRLADMHDVHLVAAQVILAENRRVRDREELDARLSLLADLIADLGRSELPQVPAPRPRQQAASVIVLPRRAESPGRLA